MFDWLNDGGRFPGLPILLSPDFYSGKKGADSTVIQQSAGLQTSNHLLFVSSSLSQEPEKKTHTNVHPVEKESVFHLQCNKGFAVIYFNKTKNLKWCLWPLRTAVFMAHKLEM